MRAIPYGKQTIHKKDIQALLGVFETDWLTQGPKVEEFEKAMARYTGAKYAVAVSNGTAALHIACLAAGLKKGTEAITTPMTFLATPNSVIYSGAKPVFADIDPDTINITPDLIKDKITSKTKVLLPVHFAGLPCDMFGIAQIAKKNGLKVIEDACHCLGGKYKYNGKWIKVGSCKHSDMTVFSFHPVKHITTGEGGMVTTNSRKLYKKLILLRSHGTVKSRSMKKNKGAWYYEMHDLGYNYRLTDFQCALGISQLQRIDEFLNRRRDIAKEYDREFSGIDGVSVNCSSKDKKHAYHLYLLAIDYDKFKTTRKKFVQKLSKKGILTQVHYIPIYRQPYYKKAFSYMPKQYPASEKYYSRALSIPMYPGMTKKDIKKVVSVIKKTLNEG